jgi:GntR family transcriptional regulator
MQNVSKAISEKLNEMIENDILKVNEKLPSEINMAKHFGVSRETYRNAIKILEEEGKLQVKHGVGTFVIVPLPSIQNRMDKLDSIGNMIKNAGFKEDEKKEKIKVIDGEDNICNFLNIGTEEKLIKLERYRIVDGEEVAYSINYMPYNKVGCAFEKNKLSGSLFGFLREYCSIDILCSDTEFCVADPLDRKAQKINSEGKRSVVLLKQLHYTKEHIPILYSYDYLRNDIFTFSIRRNM